MFRNWSRWERKIAPYLFISPFYIVFGFFFVVPIAFAVYLGFTEWRSFLKNDHLTAALIDRLTENSHVINMKNCLGLRAKLSP